MKQSIRVVLTALLLLALGVAGCGGPKDGGKEAAAPAAAKTESVPSLWVAGGTLMDAAIYRIDPASNKEIGKIPVEASIGGLAVAENSLWASDFGNSKLLRFDLATNKQIAAIPVVDGPRAIVVSPGAVWVASSLTGEISRVDPASNKVIATIAVTNVTLNDLAFVDNSVWAVGVDFTLYQIDPQTNQVASKVKLGNLPRSVQGRDGKLWVTLPMAGQLLQIDAATKKIVQTLVVGNPIAAVPLSNGIATVDSQQSSVSFIDVAHGNAKSDLAVGASPRYALAAFDSLWISGGSDNQLQRIDPLSKKVIASIPLKNAACLAAQ